MTPEVASSSYGIYIVLGVIVALLIYVAVKHKEIAAKLGPGKAGDFLDDFKMNSSNAVASAPATPLVAALNANTLVTQQLVTATSPPAGSAAGTAVGADHVAILAGANDLVRTALAAAAGTAVAAPPAAAAPAAAAPGAAPTQASDFQIPGVLPKRRADGSWDYSGTIDYSKMKGLTQADLMRLGVITGYGSPWLVGFDLNEYFNVNPQFRTGPSPAEVVATVAAVTATGATDDAAYAKLIDAWGPLNGAPQWVADRWMKEHGG